MPWKQNDKERCSSRRDGPSDDKCHTNLKVENIMFLKQIYDPGLSQYAYLIGCQRTGEALLIDPQRDIDRYEKIAAENDLGITAVAETHIHADFVSGVREFLGSGENVHAYLSDMGDVDWKYEWARGRKDVTLLMDGDIFNVGNIQIKVLHTPGHTPEHICFLVEDHGGGADEPMALVSGDFIFVGDVGRPDLLESAAGEVGNREPSARKLYQSIVSSAELPDYLQVLPGHGAGSACGKSLGSIPSTTIGYERRFNSAMTTALEDGEDSFVEEILSGQPEPPAYFARMKKVNKDGIAILGGLPDPEKLTPSDIVALVDSDAVFLDVRTDRLAFMEAHLQGALFTPFASKFSVAAGSYLDPGQAIYLLVENGEQVEACVRELIRMGFDDVRGYALVREVLLSSECESRITRTQRITISQMEEEHRRNPGSTILDVRSADEYQQSHLEGALNIAYTRLAAEQDRLPGKSNGPLIVHCASGVRASLATPYLERIGYEVLYADGLFSDWEAQNALANKSSN
jgi:hydroxyacylglutathione hydrolase